MANQPPLNYLPVALCRFSYIGIISLAHHLRQIPAFNSLDDNQLRAAAIAILSAGATTDGNHSVAPHRFHPIYSDLNNKNKTRMPWRHGLRDWCLQTAFDLLVMIDRAGGGATMLIHTPATRPPGTNAVVGEAKMEVLLPKVLLEERPAVGFALSHIVQYFAEHVAVPAMLRFDDAANTSAWPNAGAPAPPSERGLNQPVIPISNSPRYVFYGRPPGDLDAIISQQVHGHPPLPPPIPAPIPALTPAPTAPPPTQTPPAAAPAAPAAASTHVAQAEDDDDWVVEEDGEERKMVSPRGKPRIKLALSSRDPYSAEELRAWGEANYNDVDDEQEPDGARSAKGKQRQRDSPRDPRLAAKLGALQLRIGELESIKVAHELESAHLAETVAGLNERVAELQEVNTTQDMEIIGLRSALRSALTERGDGTNFHTSRVGTPTRMSRSSTTDTFGNTPRGAAPSTPSSPSTGSSISSVSSVSTSTASTSTPRRTHARLGVMTPTRSSQLPTTPSRSTRYSVDVFGLASDRVVSGAHLPDTTHDVLRDVYETSSMEQWVPRLQRDIPGCTLELALALANAMADDATSAGGREA
ncbi:hypothetical protein OH76DRAFT_1489685 [Lentinus brumalis]|uniref:Uncharacterized protein n=1 Tax=Lentinus brumalis TaxID=2498619 RepID=A0A371CLN7_9APHY|nr:hypothetical protein OH76DRAFT_1489685 [Polyporus brumalis]